MLPITTPGFSIGTLSWVTTAPNFTDQNVDDDFVKYARANKDRPLTDVLTDGDLNVDPLKRVIDRLYQENVPTFTAETLQRAVDDFYENNTLAAVMKYATRTTPLPTTLRSQR